MGDIDAMRRETDEFLAQDDPDAYAEILKQRAELVKQRAEELADQQQAQDVGQEDVPPAEGGDKEKAITRITAVNGSVFSLGETLPWKGLVFQLVHLDKEFIGLQAIGLTNAEVKRMMKTKSNA